MLHNSAPLESSAPPLLPSSFNTAQGTSQYPPKKADTGLDFLNQTLLLDFPFDLPFVLHLTLREPLSWRLVEELNVDPLHDIPRQIR